MGKKPTFKLIKNKRNKRILIYNVDLDEVVEVCVEGCKDETDSMDFTNII